jgi:hypothetical protein
MIERLAFRAPPDLGAAARAQGAIDMLGGLVILRSTPGAGPKARLVAREAFPTRAFMRTWSPLARRGPAGMAAAYAHRPFWLARRLPAAYRAYRRARAASDSSA